MILHKLLNKIIKAMNWVCQIFGARYGEDGRFLTHNVWMHWSNENEDRVLSTRDRTVYGWPYHGRWWMHAWGRTFRFSWHLWTDFCGASINADDEDGLRFHAAFPPVAIWFTVPIPAHKWLSKPFWDKWNQKYGGYPGSNKYSDFNFFSIRVFDWAIWWDFLKFDWGWSNQMPRWMHGSWHFLDTILGEQKYTNEVLSTHEVLIPMPEGSYPATVKLELATWKRARWPFKKSVRRSDIDIPVGIPHQGKGENSWDCGEDALYGQSGGECWTVDKAISGVVESALSYRRKYDGNTMAVYPPAAERIAAWEARKKATEQVSRVNAESGESDG